MSGRRLIIGLIVMGVAVPATLFFLLGLRTFSQFFTVAATTFLSWGVADLWANIVEKPRLKNRSARGVMSEEFDRRSSQ